MFSQLFRVLGTGDRLFVHRLRESAARRARRGGRLRGAADPHRRAALRRRDPRLLRQARHRDALLRDRRALKALAGRSRARRCRSSIGAAIRCRSPPTRRWRSRSSSPTQVQIGLPRVPLPDRGRRPRRDHVARRRGDRDEGPGAGAGAARARARRTCWPAAPEPPARWTFVVRFPAARRQAALDELGDIDRTVEIRDARETIATHASELTVENGRAGRARARRAGTPARRRRHRRRSHDGAGRDPGRRLPAGRGRSPARAPWPASSSRWCW